MLPFLKPKTIAGLIISKRLPDGGKDETTSEGNEDQGLISCAEDLIRAIHSKDAKGVADAFKAAYEMCESYDEPKDQDESEQSESGEDQE